MSLQDEGFRFVFENGIFTWKHPACIGSNAIDLTDMPDSEFSEFVFNSDKQKTAPNN